MRSKMIESPFHSRLFGNMVFEIQVAIKCERIHLPGVSVGKGSYQKPDLKRQRWTDMINQLIREERYRYTYLVNIPRKVTIARSFILPPLRRNLTSASHNPSRCSSSSGSRSTKFP